MLSITLSQIIYQSLSLQKGSHVEPSQNVHQILNSQTAPHDSLSQNIQQILNSQKAPHVTTSRAIGYNYPVGCLYNTVNISRTRITTAEHKSAFQLTNDAP